MVQIEFKFNCMSISVFGKGKVPSKAFMNLFYKRGVCVYAKHCLVDIHERK